MINYWGKNIEALKAHKPRVHELVANHKRKEAGDFLHTPAGIPTLKYSSAQLAYNPDNPMTDAAAHLHTVDPQADGLALFCGFGLGYGAKLVHEQRCGLQMLVILEPSLDMFCAALQATDLTPLISSDKVYFHVGDINWEEFQDTVSDLSGHRHTYVLAHPQSYEWQPALYNAMKDRAYKIVNELNISTATTLKFGDTFIRNRLRNLTLARHSHHMKVLKDKFAGMPAILISSGPSLTQSLPSLKTAQGRCILIAVDGAIAPLLKEGILPDFVTSLDIKDCSLEKMAPYFGGQQRFNLVSMFQVTPHIPQRLGVANIFFASETDEATKWLETALDASLGLPPMSSVAHVSLMLALTMGANPIIFVGQDLSYPDPMAKHASGVINIMPGLEAENALTMQGIDGNKVRSDRAFLEIKSRLEEVIAAYPRTYINASAAGAHIAGTKAMPLPEAMATFCRKQIPTATLVAGIVKENAPLYTDGLKKTLVAKLAEIDRSKEMFAEARQHAAEIEGRLKKRSRGKKIHDFRDLDGHTKQKLKELTALNNSIDAMPIWLDVSDLTFASHFTHEQWKKKNQKLRDREGYIPWLQSELERVLFTYDVRQEVLEKYRSWLFELASFLDEEQRLGGGPDFSAQDEETSCELAGLYSKAGNFQLALQTITAGLRNWPASAPLLLQAGEVHLNLLDFSEAAEAFAKALRLDPSLESRIDGIKLDCARYWLGFIQEYGMDRPNYCRAWLKRILNLAGNDEGVNHTLRELWRGTMGTIHSSLAERNYTLADRCLDSWEPYNSRIHEWFLLAATCRDLQLDAAGATEILAAGSAAHPEKPAILAAYAKALLATGQFDKGIAYLRAAVALDKNTARLWEELGDLLSQAGDSEAAVYCYNEYAHNLPDNIEILKKIEE